MQVANFTKQFGKGDYARPNLFQLSFAGLEFGDVAAVAKAASFPAATVGVIEVPYKNRKIKVPGDRTFQDWTVTIINDEDFTVRKALMKWQEGLSSFNGPTSDLGPGANSGGTPGAHRILYIDQLARAGGSKSKGQIQLEGWPSEVGAIDLSWETTDAVQEYTVTFSVTWNSGNM
ncbi:MAG TPA: hypothetical protein EYP92_00360 [Candidatus Thioglobus sp.]|nr:hypothetical protein [Candidatus Thioglobus sp.]